MKLSSYIKLTFIAATLLLLSGCISLVSRDKLEMWALSNGYILAENCPDLVIPERQALPHPKVPVIQVRDADGELIPITQEYLMEIIIILFGTVEKYQYLAEIYEREYLNTDGQIMPDLTLDELKTLYLERVAKIDEVTPEEPEEPQVYEGEFPTTGVAGGLTVYEFAAIVDTFNYFQETGQEEE